MSLGRQYGLLAAGDLSLDSLTECLVKKAAFPTV